MKHCYLLIIIILFLAPKVLIAQSIRILQEEKPTSIRGLAVVNDKTAWVSGSKGYIGITNNGGETWNWQQIKGYEQSDFRDIEAFNDKEAIIMSSGTPALILKTIDGGKSWHEKYRNTDSLYFLDAMAFADNKHGYILGDPIAGHFLLLQTQDGGKTWTKIMNTPEALPGEASFAASGSCIAVAPSGVIQIVSGGKVSRLISSAADKEKWFYTNLPIIRGKSSQGAFSVSTSGVIVGGDYVDNLKTDSVALIYSGSLAKPAFQVAKAGPGGYQSCVAYINNKIFVSTGTSGSNISTDSGLTWHKFDSTSFNVCGKAKSGKLVLLAGDKGKIARLKL